ncbi:unnamed protein product [Sphagnum jensenii]|uniref:Uncharacterized protein n=1 Tax=Sphagnum jensenii TaxID=128206 RepID=A0ABP1AK76_9BRYO
MLVDPARYVNLDRWMLNRIMKLCFLVPWRHLHSYIGVEIELVTTDLRSGKENICIVFGAQVGQKSAAGKSTMAAVGLITEDTFASWGCNQTSCASSNLIYAPAFLHAP